MQERVAAPAEPVTIVVFDASLSAEESMTTTVRDPTEFLDIDVNQLAWPRLLVSSRWGSSYWQTRDLIKVGQQRHSITGQNPAHRGTWHA